MKLHRTLFYTLMVILTAANIISSIVDTSSVFSRIATGLISGSFVGLISTFVNYLHQRQQYFEKITSVMVDLAHSVVEDFIRFKLRIEDLSTESKYEIIQNDHKMTKENIESATQFGKKYENFSLSLDSTPYAPLFFAKNKRAKTLEELEDIVAHIHYSSGFLISCFGFGMLAVKTSKEEQEITIGDPDKFYETVMNENIEFNNNFSNHISQLASVYDSMGECLKGIVDKSYLDTWKTLAGYMRHAIECVEINDEMTTCGL